MGVYSYTMPVQVIALGRKMQVCGLDAWESLNDLWPFSGSAAAFESLLAFLVKRHPDWNELQVVQTLMHANILEFELDQVISSINWQRQALIQIPPTPEPTKNRTVAVRTRSPTRTRSLRTIANSDTTETDGCFYCGDERCPLHWMRSPRSGRNVLACRECSDELFYGLVDLRPVHFCGSPCNSEQLADVQYHGFGTLHMLNRSEGGCEPPYRPTEHGVFKVCGAY